jgi:uncharacterized damage-inducible protein DinB
VAVERTDPPYEAGERSMLTAWLDYHRATLAMKCDGLDDDQLRRRAVPPSSLSLLGLVRHMADVELNWFRRVLDGQDVPGHYWVPGGNEARTSTTWTRPTSPRRSPPGTRSAPTHAS